jgi:hypothetical protein
MKATTNTILKVSFNEKDQAKSLGARWNAESKHWYVPQGIDTAPFEKWLTGSPTLVPAQSKAKPVAKTDKNTTTLDQSFDHDIGTINAILRDAYEPRDGDTFL